MYGGESIIHRKDDQLTVHGMLVEMRNSRNYEVNMQYAANMDADETKSMLED